jgi:antitoxin MazE
MEAKLIRVGNSKGIRLPKRLIAKYELAEVVTLKELENGILIENPSGSKLSWEDTFKSMSEADEDWSDWIDLDIEDLNEDH